MVTMAQEGPWGGDFLIAMAAPAAASTKGWRVRRIVLACPVTAAVLLGLVATLTGCAGRATRAGPDVPPPPIAVSPSAANDTLGSLSPPASQTIPKLAPFVVSPPEVVSRLLILAGVSNKDVVFDLGCGDGRIVIAAASLYGARGVGVDIDAALVAQATAAATAAGVSHLVSFQVKNALDVDLSEATVVALYLLPSGNALLRPKLQRELRRGARVVAHSFDMGASWRPTKSETFYDDAGLPRIIHLWRISGRR